MEGAPLTPEYKNDDLERREKHKPNAESIGLLAMETNAEKDPGKRQYSHEHLGKTLINKETLESKTEINFEQDPVLRHQQQSSSGAVSRVSSAIGSLLSSKSDLDLTGGSSATKDDAKLASERTSLKKPSRSVADIAMFSVISLLLLLIVIVIILKAL